MSELGESSLEPVAQLQFSVCIRGILMLLLFDTNGSIAAMGGAYEFTRNASANLREKDDSLNPALGGLLAGAIMGLKREGLCSRMYGIG